MNFIEYLKENHNIILNPQQQQAVQTIDGAVLLLAVPGSGKTTVVIARIGNMIYNNNVPPSEILTLTFSVAAARDMRERYVGIFGDEFAGELQFKTIHSFCFGVIRQYERAMNTRAFDVIENNSKIIKQIYLHLYKEFAGEDTIKEIVQNISYCKNMMFTKEQMADIDIPECEFTDIYNAYENYKRRNGLMDYDDMLNYALIILRKYPEILGYYQNKFRYFNVDEAQDTSFIQHEIIRLLVSKNNNIFMVGDEDQSIYGFRAAFPKALLEFKNTYKDAKVLLMEQNYRSTKRIVDKANRFIRQNKDRYAKNMFCTNDVGSMIKETEFDDCNEQYEYICNLAKNKSPDESIAVLYRNNDSAVPIVDMFEHENVPFFIRENVPTFFTHFIVNDIKCFINLAFDMGNIDIFERIYYKMNCGITKKMIEFIKSKNIKNVFETLLDYPDLPEYTNDKIIDIKYCFKKLADMKPSTAIEFIEAEMGYAINLRNLANNGYSREILLQKMNVLKTIAAKQGTLTDFLERLNKLEEIMLNSAMDKNAVVLSTVHSSKGLEFDKVVIIDAVEGQFPNRESVRLLDKENDRSAYEEEVRLFYVGMTRAKRELEFLTAKMLNGKAIRKSRFVKYVMYKPETKKKLVKEIEKVAVKAVHIDIKDYAVGTKIVHTKFGEGTIKKLDYDTAVIDFIRCGDKTLSLPICVKNNLIKKV